MRWTDEGHRKDHRCRNPTSFSTTDQRCGMRLLSPTRKLRVLRGAPHFCAAPSNRLLLPAYSTTVFAILFRCSQFPRARCPVSCPAEQSRQGLTPLLPTIEFAERPRPPQPRAATSNGFTGRAQNFVPQFTRRRERASGKALALGLRPKISPKQNK